MADGGYPEGRLTNDPSRATAKKFRQLLSARGIEVAKGVSEVSVEASGTAAGSEQPTTTLGEVFSPPLSRVVQFVLETSDNTAAEVLAHLAGFKRLGQGSFEGGASAAISVLAELGIDTNDVRLFDGSGLSGQDAIPAVVLAELLSASANNRNPALWAITYGVPVAGFTGTLADRFLTAGSLAGRGVVRAKTGTLTAVNSLAGLVVDADGALLSFSLVTASGTSTAANQALWDEAAAALAQCGCK